MPASRISPPLRCNPRTEGHLAEVSGEIVTSLSVTVRQVHDAAHDSGLIAPKSGADFEGQGTGLAPTTSAAAASQVPEAAIFTI